MSTSPLKRVFVARDSAINFVKLFAPKFTFFANCTHPPCSSSNSLGRGTPKTNSRSNISFREKMELRLTSTKQNFCPSQLSTLRKSSCSISDGTTHRFLDTVPLLLMHILSLSPTCSIPVPDAFIYAYAGLNSGGS